MAPGRFILGTRAPEDRGKTVYIFTGKRRNQERKRNKSAKYRAKLKAKNRRRVNGMKGRKLGKRL